MVPPYFVSLLLQSATHGHSQANRSHTTHTRHTHKLTLRWPAFTYSFLRYSTHIKSPPSTTTRSPILLVLHHRRPPSSLFSLFTFIVTFFCFYIHHRCFAWHFSLSESANSYSSPNYSHPRYFLSTECWTLRQLAFITNKTRPSIAPASYFIAY